MKSTLGLLSFAMTLAAAMPAWAQQAASFNRVTTVRREVTAGPAQAGQNAARSLTQTASRPGNSTRFDAARAQAASLPSSAHPNSSWNQEPRRALPPVPAQVTTTPHSYYPNMRVGQSINRNVATHRCTQSRAGFLTSGGMSSMSAPRGVHSGMNSTPSPRGVHR
jgi:hypothetical protein